MKKLLTVAVMLLTAMTAQANITVNGEGKVYAVPNKAQITLGVNTNGQNAADALAANSVAMQRLFEALKALGIADRDVQTVALNLTPNYRHGKDQEPILIGYTANHQISVTVRKVDETGTVLDTLVKDGANHVQGISFGLDESDKLLDEARVKAVEDARRKAELYAAAAGVKVGKVLSISEIQVSWPAPRMWSLDEFEAAKGTPVAKGEQQLSASITVVFALGETK